MRPAPVHAAPSRTAPIHPLLFLALAAACADKAPGDDTGAPRVGAPDERCAGFSSTPSSWSVPDSDFVFLYWWDSTLGERFSVIDLDGDGRRDLVVTREGVSDVPGSDGDFYWEFYQNTGEGFAAAAAWPVPSADESDLNRAYEANDHFAVLDLNGDGLPDLVRALDPETGALPGGAEDPHWLLYPGDGAGFAAEPTTWPIPASAGEEFDALSSGASYHSWATLDLDGDGRPDLVHASDPDGSGGPFGSVEAPVWHLYRNTGAGFEASPVDWPLPTGHKKGSFGTWEGEVGNYRHRLADLDADGRVDLVETFETDTLDPSEWSDAEGYTFWKIYANTGAGFEPEGAPWWTPDANFDLLDLPRGWSSSEALTWRTADMGGGGTLDLVIAADPDATDTSFTDGGPHWRVYPSAQTGFAFEPVAWALPSADYNRLWSGDPAGAGAWDTFDLNGDGCADLVATAPPGADWPGSSQGEPWAWTVYLGE